ncbi:MAG: FAD-binding oxidoreductase [Candidatus Kapaibacterium sp.]|nr:MAG: FAD-binding oxidoreductase [Candidatus Kapabacteria bacterium]
MRSFWEYDALTRADVIIVGAGIMGLSTAISVKERLPTASVLVLERGILPSGASTRNAGFACFGSLTEILSDIHKNGEDATLRLVEQRWRGLQMLRQRLGDEAMSFEQHGGYETLCAEQLSAIDSLERVNAALRGIFISEHDSAPTVFVLKNEHIAHFGFNQNRVKALLHSPFEGQIHSGRMMQALSERALAHGVRILTGADVVALEEEPHQMRCVVRHLGNTLDFFAKHCILATNAFLPELLPESSIQPARGQILVTTPIPALPFRGVFHYDEGFYYFRNLATPEGQRILLGGGRNLAFEEETSTALDLNPRIQTALEELLRTTIAPDVQYDIAHRWSGIMGFREDKLPEVRRISARRIIAFGCNGMGVALSSVLGEEAASLLA